MRCVKEPSDNRTPRLAAKCLHVRLLGGCPTCGEALACLGARVHSLAPRLDTRGTCRTRHTVYRRGSTSTGEGIQRASRVCGTFKETKSLTSSSIHLTVNLRREHRQGRRPGQALNVHTHLDALHLAPPPPPPGRGN